MDPYLIIGNGVAAVSAIEAIRRRDRDTPIIVLTDQECVFYSRPSLYYILLGRIEFDDAWGRPDDFYRRNGVELRCSTMATKLDPLAHTVEADAGESLRYSKLLLATGTRGRVLPWAAQDLRGIVTLNTLADVVSISQLLSTGKHAVIAGGGLTSIELVESCRRWGLATTFVMRADHFLDKQLTADEAELVHQRLRADGVDLRANEEIVSVTGRDGRVASASLKSAGEEIACDIAACTVGVVPNRELAQAVGAQTDQGIVVDHSMQATLPDVFAAGDVAQVRGADGTPARSEMLWYVAADMGRVAGANMAGADEHYSRRAYLNVSEFCGLDFAGVGEITPGQPDVEETLIRGRDEAGSIRLVVRDGVLIGACFLGDVRLADIARGLIAAGVRPADLRSDHPIRALLDAASPSTMPPVP
ncbi:MAG: NAD(P)/FAD-dependent oxidoreductase [Armatimonadota bacterium]